MSKPRWTNAIRFHWERITPSMFGCSEFWVIWSCFHYSWSKTGRAYRRAVVWIISVMIHDLVLVILWLKKMSDEEGKWKHISLVFITHFPLLSGKFVILLRLWPLYGTRVRDMSTSSPQHQRLSLSLFLLSPSPSNKPTFLQKPSNCEEWNPATKDYPPPDLQSSLYLLGKIKIFWRWRSWRSRRSRRWLHPPLVHCSLNFILQNLKKQKPKKPTPQ